MVKVTSEFVKNTIVVVSCVATVGILSIILYTSRQSKLQSLESGNIEHAMETEQYSK